MARRHRRSPPRSRRSQRGGLITVQREPTLAAGRSAADQNRVAATFVLPAGFSAAIGHGRPARLQVLGSVDSSIGAQVAQSIAQSYADRIDTARIVVAGRRRRSRSARGRSPRCRRRSRSRTSRPGAASSTPGRSTRRGWPCSSSSSRCSSGSRASSRSDATGRSARMLVAPIRRSAVLAGKLLTSLVLGFASMVVLALATHFLLSAHWGNVFGVAILIVAGVLAATAVMALVATLRAHARTGAIVAGDGRARARECSAARSSRSHRRAGCSPRSASPRRRPGSCAGSRT